MPEIIRAGTDADFLALLPAFVGMRVERSLVLVTFAGSRTLHGARFDLPDRRDTRTLRSLADACVSLASRTPGADGVALVVATDSTFEAERGIPWHELARVLDSRMTRAGFRIMSMLCTAGDGWGRYDASGDDRGPWPLREIAESAGGGRAAVLDVGLDAPSALATRPDEEPELFTAIDAAIDRIVDEWEFVATMGPDHDDIVLHSTAVTIHRQVEDALAVALLHGSSEVDPELLGLFTAYAGTPSWRDIITLQIAFGRTVGVCAAERQREWNRQKAERGGSMDEVVAAALAAGDAVERDGDELILGRGDRQPDVDRCRAGIGTLLRAAANVEEPARPGLLCMAGWLCWAIGRASAAGVLLTEALEIEPGHRMCRLLSTLIVAGAVPEWAFAPAGEPDSDGQG
jgi:hypothetical protein